MLFLLEPGFVYSQSDYFPVGGFNLQLTDRPGVPYTALNNYNRTLTQQGSGPLYPVPVSRHHIIPFSTLRGFYNRVATDGHLRELSSFLNVFSSSLNYYAGANGLNCRTIRSDIIEAENLAWSQSLGMAIYDGEQNAPGFDTFEQFYAWLPGNLFIGPTERNDDPNNGFETASRIIVESETYDELLSLYNEMRQYIADGNVDLLRKISMRLSRIAKKQRIYQLNSNDWKEDKNGKYVLKTPRQSTLTTNQIDDIKIGEECNNISPTFINTLTAATLLLGPTSIL